ncbi:unnamed protein product, partial [Ranitomeya imitator]
QELNNEQIDNLNDENWKALYQELEDVLKENTCTVSDVLGIDALENLAEPVAITVSKIVEILRPILTYIDENNIYFYTDNTLMPMSRDDPNALEKSGLDKPAFSALCGLTKKLLAPQCLPYIVGADIPKLIIDLKTQACPGHNKDIVLEDLKNIVRQHIPQRFTV